MSTAVDHLDVRYRRADIVGPWTTLSIPPGQQTYFLPGAFVRGQTYQIEARTVGSNGAASVWVQVAHTVAAATLAPGQADNLIAYALTNGVQLEWDVNGTLSADAVFELQRTGDISGAADDASWVDLITVRQPMYVDPVANGTLHWYRVRSTNYAQISTDWSNTVSKTNYVASTTPGSASGPDEPQPNPRQYGPDTN